MLPSASTLVSFRPEQRKEGKILPGKREATFLPRDSCSRWGVRDKLARTDSNTFPLSFSAYQSARIYVDRVRVCVWRERGAQTDYVCGWVWKGEKILASRLCGGLIPRLDWNGESGSLVISRGHAFPSQPQLISFTAMIAWIIEPMWKLSWWNLFFWAKRMYVMSFVWSQGRRFPRNSCMTIDVCQRSNVF